MTNTAQIDPTFAAELATAEGWLEDCFEDLPADLTPGEIVDGINRHYVGGWVQFIADSL